MRNAVGDPSQVGDHLVDPGNVACTVIDVCADVTPVAPASVKPRAGDPQQFAHPRDSYATRLATSAFHNWRTIAERPRGHH
ncbi:hypothetical protein I547_6136 [Mycobacterium kansasii 824]|nr:hypothetical protein I547_6136 [Mycobacterium kansasii 824]